VLILKNLLVFPLCLPYVYLKKLRSSRTVKA